MLDEMAGTRTILVIEDDGSNGAVFEMVISSETAYKPLLIQNAAEALRRIEEIKASKPALFIIDYHLLAPLTGITLYDRLHAIKELENIPAIIVTAQAPDRIAEELAQRRLMFLSKPFELDELLSIIKRVIDEPSS